MHDIFVTDGIVLGKRLFGEANTSVAVLTRDFGVIRVGARSARLERSKLRYGLETLTHGTFSLVRGRYEWKLTGAQNLARTYVGHSLGQRRAAGRVARLLLRLIHGEDPVPELYASVANGLAYLAGEAREEDIEHVECVLVLRILSYLGYVEQGGRVEMFLENNEFTPALAEQARGSRPLLIRTINESLGATGL
jgi:DNA repair protein RecO